MVAFDTHATNNAKIDLTGDWYLWIVDFSPQYFLSSLNTDINGYPVYSFKQDGNKIIGTGNGKFGSFLVEGVIQRNDIVPTGTVGEMDAQLAARFEDGKIIVDLDETDFRMKRKKRPFIP